MDGVVVVCRWRRCSEPHPYSIEKSEALLPFNIIPRNPGIEEEEEQVNRCSIHYF